MSPISALLPTGRSTGRSAVLQEKVDPGAVLGAVQQYAITSLSGVPTTFQLLAEHPDWDGADLSTLRKLTCGGSSVPLRVIEAYEKRGLSFSSGYGMTETSPGATSLPYRKAREHVGSSGVAHFFTDVRVVDADGKPLPAGEIGEVEISGPNVMKAYWLRPDATRDSHRGEWLRSGDIGVVDEDGYLTISDRVKDMIISGGENIYPGSPAKHRHESVFAGRLDLVNVVVDRELADIERAGNQLDSVSQPEHPARTQLAHHFIETEWGELGVA